MSVAATSSRGPRGPSVSRAKSSGRIPKPNGLATDRAERYLFVNAFMAKELRIYELATGTLKKTVPLPGLPDNLQWEVEDRKLDIALHPGFLRIAGHLNLPPHSARRLNLH